MALKIVAASDPLLVEQLVVVVYGQPGIGKTSLAFTADAPLLLDFDRGAYRATNRKDTVQVSSWKDVGGISEDDLAPYKTIIVDTAGRALDFLTQDILQNPKMGRNGALTLQGYGQLKARFQSWLKLLHTFGKDVILIAHATEQKNGEDIVVRLDVQGGSKDEVYKAADVIGWLHMLGRDRIFSLDPSDAAYGKNPGKLAAINVTEAPDTMAKIIANTKEAIMSRVAAGKSKPSLEPSGHLELEAIRADYELLETVDDFQRAVDFAIENNIPHREKQVLFDVLSSRGLAYDRRSGLVVVGGAA